MPDQHDPQAPRPRRLRRGLIATAASAAIVVAGLGVASAQTESSTTTAPAPPNKTEASPGPGKAHFRGGPGPKGFFGGFPGGHGGIHSESTFKDPDGEGYRTMASQVGEVVEVSSSSLEVKSEDGYSRTYKVDEGTLVNAGRDGIANVKKGDQVHVTALVADGTATAKRVSDLTNLERFREQWGGRKPR